MRKAGYTNAPCHGCGSTLLHRKDSVCETCSRAMSTYAKIVESQESSDEKRLIVMTERDYAIPRMWHEKRTEDGKQPICAPLFELSMLLSEPCNEFLSTYDDKKGEAIKDNLLWDYPRGANIDFRVVRRMNPVVVRLLRELQIGTRESLAAAHRDGVKEGRNLLMSLADGSITNDQFNERAARLESE